MIPFLPVLCYITAYYLDRLEKSRDKKIPLFTASIPYMILIIWILLNREELVLSEYWTLFLGDAVIMIICWLIYYKKRIMLCFLICQLFFYSHLDLSCMLNMSVIWIRNFMNR